MSVGGEVRLYFDQNAFLAANPFWSSPSTSMGDVTAAAGLGLGLGEERDLTKSPKHCGFCIKTGFAASTARAC